MFSSLKFSTLRSRSKTREKSDKVQHQDEDQNDDQVSCTPSFRCQQPFTKCTKQSNKMKYSSKQGVDPAHLSTISYSHSDTFLPPIIKTKDVFIERDDEGSLGLTLQGGLHQNSELSRPLVVTHVRPDGPTSKEGTIQIGDRLLAVDGFPLDKVTLNEAYNVLKNSDGQTSRLTIEYDITNMKRFCSPLLVEMESPHPHQLGITLTNTPHNSAVLIDEIKPASIAERCGALFPGDQILSVNDTRIEGSRMPATEVYKLLRICGGTHSNLLLQILPANVFEQSQMVQKSPIPYYYPETGISFESINANNYYEVPNEFLVPKTFPINLDESTRVEIMNVTLHSDERLGYGLSVYSQQNLSKAIISFINPGGPADLCEILQVNDRILSINNRPITEIGDQLLPLHLIPGVNLGVIHLLVEYELYNSHVHPNDTIITVELTKYNRKNLGITVTGNNECMQISEIKKGSVADRCGVLSVGDRILSINHRILSESTVQEASRLSNENIEYTVQLNKQNGTIGITVSGSDTNPRPIIISALTPGGLAEKTGALHVGDRVLEINEYDVRNVLLSEAMSILHNSSDKVLFKVSRSLFYSQKNATTFPDQDDLSQRVYGSPGLLSDDSAIESWESSTKRDISPNDTPFSSDPQNGRNISPENGAHQIGFEQSNTILKLSNGICREEPVYSNILYHRNNIDQYNNNNNNNNNNSYYDQVPCKNDYPVDKYYRENLYENNHLSRYHDHYNKVDEIFNIADLRDMHEQNETSDDIYQVILFKDPLYEDFGFSISDGLYERGVFLNRIRKEGPADKIGLLKPFDQIIQVNNVRTEDFDCCLTVPLIASAGDRITLTVKRKKSDSNFNSVKRQMNSNKWQKHDDEQVSTRSQQALNTTHTI